jgi:predicted metalloprotease
MRWSGGRRGGNIEDRRGMGGGVVGGVGAGGVILALIGYFVFGIDPSTTLKTVDAVGGGGQQQQQAGVEGTPKDDAGDFVDVVATSVDDVWTNIFQKNGERYPPPKVVLYSQGTPTGCGAGEAAMGPFYCPNDQKVYLDLSFWDELAGRFGADGEAARAYVIAHEIGHHVQNLTGQMGRAERLGQRGADSGSVRLELQADCYAGIWAAQAGTVSQGQVSLDPQDIEKGLKAAAAVGDDTLQKQTQGRVVPDAFTHGTSEQRMRWFRKGVDAQSVAACDTFKAASL